MNWTKLVTVILFVASAAGAAIAAYTGDSPINVIIVALNVTIAAKLLPLVIGQRRNSRTVRNITFRADGVAITVQVRGDTDPSPDQVAALKDMASAARRLLNATNPDANQAPANTTR